VKAHGDLTGFMHKVHAARASEQRDSGKKPEQAISRVFANPFLAITAAIQQTFSSKAG
jgi:hypothetical protein